MNNRNRRRATSALVLALGLTGAGFGAAALTPEPNVAIASEDKAALVSEGSELYATSCVSCHGVNLQGVKDRGPSLVGTGEGAVYFQVHSGRMPMMENEAQAIRKAPRFSERQTLALAAYVDTYGGGAELIRENGEISLTNLRGASGNSTPAEIAQGGELFRLNCASCHNFTGRGGALSSGKFAPILDPANEQEIYQAMLSGPQNMPKFSDRQLTPDQKRNIIAYIKSSGETLNPSGWTIGGLGPVTEGMAIFLVGLAAAIGGALWIGTRS